MRITNKNFGESTLKINNPLISSNVINGSGSIFIKNNDNTQCEKIFENGKLVKTNYYFDGNSDGNFTKNEIVYSSEYKGAKLDKYRKKAKKSVNELSQRINQKGQFLSWANLPIKQLDEIDKFYDLADKIKNDSQNTKLCILGIGGSKHPIEHMLSATGLNPDNQKVDFYSDIDSTSWNSFLNKYKDENGNIDLSKLKFLVVSKSGSTFETKDSYLRIFNELVKEYQAKGQTEDEAQFSANKHFIAVTDSSKNKSQLRKMANENNWAGDLQIHDDVGGRFSAFDDHVLFSLAFAGMSKDDMRKMLLSAQKVSENALNPNIDDNEALKEGYFRAISKNNKNKNAVTLFLGKMFENSVNWRIQLHNESIKDTNEQVLKITDGMHHSAEAHFNPKNKYYYSLIAPIDNGECRENVENYIKALKKTYNGYGNFEYKEYQTNEIGLTPEALGLFTQQENFAIIYEDIAMYELKGKKLPDVLDCVLQPHVEAYKKNLKGTVEAGKISK